MNKYIDDDKQKGILIDWKKARKDYKKLNIPDYLYNPCREPLEKAKHHIVLSQRSSGKTTNLLLLGMILNKNHGIIIHYIRSREDYISNKHIKDLFSTIQTFGYIEKITDGKYNSCIYHARRWYYCLKDEDGNIIEQDNNHFMICMSYDNNETYKSSYTCPVADYVIVDEFIERYYYPNSFILLMDLLMTLKRSRLSMCVFYSANTIDKNTIWFDEFMIKKHVNSMKLGEQKLIVTEQGTPINVHLYSTDASHIERNKLQKLSNLLYFGFSNPKLSSITGDDWSMANYPHIPDYNYDVVSKNHYISFSTDLLRLTIVNFDKIGVGVIVTKSTTSYDDSIIYTSDSVIDYRYRYAFGYSKLDKYIWNLYKKRKFYYSSNEVGAIVESYINQFR